MMNRRRWIQSAVTLSLLVLSAPIRALAAAWNKAAFDARNLDTATQALDVTQTDPSRDIVLTAPDMAENGAIVQIEVESRIPGTEAIAILVEKNPTPLIANFLFYNGTDPYVVTRIKMAETSELKAVVKAGGKYYSVVRKVEVALGGCG